jgi:type 1 fimbria pilin
MKSKILFLAFFSLLAFASCHKHDDEGDAQAPALTIEDPTEGESISGEVHVHGKVTDASLHEMEIKVTKDSDGSEVFKATPTVHDKTEYDFDEHFTPSGLTAETPVTLTITVEDHNANVTTKTVKFKVKP